MATQYWQCFLETETEPIIEASGYTFEAMSFNESDLTDLEKCS